MSLPIMPRTGRMVPSRPSSPMKTSSWWWSIVMLPAAVRMAMAIGRSRLLLSFGTSAGARLMLTRLRGITSPELLNAPRMRSLASSTFLDAAPTITMLGKLFDKWHSISTGIPSLPWLIILRIRGLAAAGSFGVGSVVGLVVDVVAGKFIVP
jgi:hypothetical protein